MYEIGSTILYGGQGVCRIEKIEQKCIGKETAAYYVLKPIYDDRATVYVPIKNQALLDKMRAVMSREEIDDLITRMPQLEDWTESEHDRKAEYQQVLREGKPKELLRLIRTVYGHEQKQKERGKRLHQVDERALQEAIRLLHDEFALVLHIDPKDVVQYIADRVQDGHRQPAV